MPVSAVRQRRDLAAAIRPLAALLFSCTAAPAAAQAGAVVSIFSDDRFRGVSVSDEEPVAILDLSYDASSGIYLAASGTAVASGGVKPLSLQLNAGYAKRLDGELTFDLGAIHSSYSHYSTTVGSSAYTEIYAGLSRKSLTARIHLSPHYFQAGTWTVYGELEHGLGLTRNLSLNSHVGLLVPVRTGEEASSHAQVDWRIGLDQQLGRFGLHAAFTGAAGVKHYEQSSAQTKAGFLFGASLAL